MSDCAGDAVVTWDPETVASSWLERRTPEELQRLAERARAPMVTVLQREPTPEELQRVAQAGALMAVVARLYPEGTVAVWPAGVELEWAGPVS